MIASAARALVFVAVGAVASAAGPAQAADAASVAAPEAAVGEAGSDRAPALEPEAIAAVSRMGDALRAASRFGFTAETGYEVVQSDGTKVEFGEERHYLVERPDHVRIETLPREGDRRLVVFDGSSLVQADLVQNVYARADLKTPRDIDFMVDLVRERLDAPVPLGELLRNDPNEAIESSLDAADYVGEEILRGVAVDHVLLRNPDTDVQIWIARGKLPVPMRVVITYLDLEGQPGFQADLSDWSFDPEIPSGSFTYQPPSGAERVRFEVRAAPPPPGEAVPTSAPGESGTGQPPADGGAP